MLNLERRRTTTHGHHLDSVLSHYGNLLCLFKVERQETFVLKEHDTLLAYLLSSSIVLIAAQRAKRTVLVAGSAEDETEHTTHLVVKFLCTDLAFFDEFLIRTSHVIVVVGIGKTHLQAIGPCAILKVKTVEDSLLGALCSSPVGNDSSIEAPFALQDLVHEIIVMASMLTAEEIVATHDAPCATLDHSCLECRQIDLAERTFIGNGIGSITVHLIVVQCIMLDTDSHAIALHTLDIAHCHTAREIWVFTKVLKAASVERSAADVDTRTEKHSLVAIASLLAYALAIEKTELLVPSSSKTGQGRESHTRVVGPTSLIPIIPQHFRTDAVRTIGTPQFRNTETRHTCRRELRLGMYHPNLLVQSHLAHHIVNTSLNVVGPRIRRLRRRTRTGNSAQ